MRRGSHELAHLTRHLQILARGDHERALADQRIPVGLGVAAGVYVAPAR
jgi:hypothetical protein